MQSQNCVPDQTNIKMKHPFTLRYFLIEDTVKNKPKSSPNYEINEQINMIFNGEIQRIKPWPKKYKMTIL